MASALRSGKKYRPKREADPAETSSENTNTRSNYPHQGSAWDHLDSSPPTVEAELAASTSGEAANLTPTSATEKRTALGSDDDATRPVKRLCLWCNQQHHHHHHHNLRPLTTTADRALPLDPVVPLGPRNMRMCLHCRAWADAATLKGVPVPPRLCNGHQGQPFQHALAIECKHCEQRGVPCSFVQDIEADGGASNGISQYEKAKRLACRELDWLCKVAYLEKLLSPDHHARYAREWDSRMQQFTIEMQVRQSQIREELEMDLRRHRRAIHDELDAWRSAKVKALDQEVQGATMNAKIKEADWASVRQEIRNQTAMVNHLLAVEDSRIREVRIVTEAMNSVNQRLEAVESAQVDPTSAQLEGDLRSPWPRRRPPQKQNLRTPVARHSDHAHGARPPYQRSLAAPERTSDGPQAHETPRRSRETTSPAVDPIDSVEQI